MAELGLFLLGGLDGSWHDCLNIIRRAGRMESIIIFVDIGLEWVDTVSLGYYGYNIGESLYCCEHI